MRFYGLNRQFYGGRMMREIIQHDNIIDHAARFLTPLHPVK